MLLLAVAGVRPAEVAAGIGVQPIDGGVELKIKGAKTDRGHGQPDRVIEAVGPLALMLAEGGARTTPETTANAVSVAAEKLGRKVFGVRRSNLVSAYSFRHQYAPEDGVVGAQRDLFARVRRDVGGLLRRRPMPRPSATHSQFLTIARKIKY